ncbi:hypothetical protein [Emticicia sp. C21]|uniref:hypothetical protein n=1 Tax=Emticicia sp. C21 TaxID=2302915 RepID=UPI000E34A306|nr:hypothetical protein [Emticicia sp. C21]RFS17016.1 hypothetical protein D0T08_10080 [Emticicia sp. C21]
MRKIFILLLFVVSTALGQSVSISPTDPSHLIISKPAGTAQLTLKGESAGEFVAAHTKINLEGWVPYGNSTSNTINFGNQYNLIHSIITGSGAFPGDFGIYRSSVPLLYHSFNTGLELVSTTFKEVKEDLAVFYNTQALSAGLNSSIYFKTGNYHTGGIKTTGTGSNAARLGLFTSAGTFPTNLVERLSITNAGLVGIGLTNPNDLLDVNGRARIRHNGATAGIWMSNSTNSLTMADGAFYGNKGDTETGIWIGNGWRFWVNSTGNATITGLAGTGTRNVYADANGMLTTTAPAPKTDYYSVAPASFKPVYNNSGTFTADDLYSQCLMSNGSTDKLVAGINLPHGATVTQIEVYYTNTIGAKRFDVSLYKSAYNDILTSTVVSGETDQAGVSSNDIKSNVFVVPNPSVGAVNNTTHTYKLWISVETTAGAETSWSSGMGIKGVKITYTL